MRKFQASIRISADADSVFDFVSDPNNLPAYLPTLEEAEYLGDDRIRLQGTSPAGPYETEGLFEVNRDNRRMEWSAEGDHGYRGWLYVRSNGANSEVMVHISFEGENDGHVSDEQMRASLRETLELIRVTCESSVEAKAGDRRYLI